MSSSLPFYPFQKQAADWLAELRHALLSLDMGLGKTATAILAANQANVQKAIVVCPAVAVTNWKRELVRWGAKFLSQVTSYQSVHKIKDADVDLLILDESQYVKNIKAKRSVNIFGTGGLAHKASRVWCLSGTPAPNNASELWIMLYAFGQTKLSYDEFVERFCTVRKIPCSNRYRPVGTKKQNIEELQAMLRKVMYRKTADEVGLELPAITYETVILTSPNDEKDIWEALWAERDAVLAFLKTRDDLENIADSLSTMRRISGLQKVEKAIPFLEEELDGGLLDSVVVFAHHREVVEAITARLRRFGAVAVYGGVDDRQRQHAIDSFQAGKAKVFVGNIQASGTAITLTRSNNIVFVESDWTPANMAQAVKRCHRIGQTRPLHVRFLSLDDHIDEMITRILERKTKELTQLFRPTGIHGEISSENSPPPENNFEKILD